jgi:hypothetical protein
MTKTIGNSALLDAWAATGTRITPTDSELDAGWAVGQQPSAEVMNFLQGLPAEKINHILQNGIPVWNNTTPYVVSSFAQFGGVLYQCVLAHTNHQPPNVTYWSVFSPGGGGGGGTVGPAGGGVSIPYVFDTTTTDADPGNGKLRLSSATQNTSTVIRADLLDANTADWSSVLATLADSTNTIKGHIRLFNTADPTKWLVFSVSAVAAPTGYKNITVAIVGSSSANPFANADALTLSFTRAGDVGSNGSAGSSGANGSNFLVGSGAPAGGTGANGDYYLDNADAGLLYGPKAAGAWPAGVILRRMAPRIMRPGMADSPATNYGRFGVRNAHPFLAYDGTTQETSFWEDYMPLDYHGGNLIVDVYWMAASATTGGAVFDATFERLASGGQDEDSDGFATAQQCASVTTNAASGVLAKSTVTCTVGAAGTSSIAAGDPFRLRLRRVPADAGDTITTDVQVTRVVVREA